ncbi:MAG: hypothetical protein ACXAD7_27975 [Candidatus Kariarchaeaceae archaeon]
MDRDTEMRELTDRIPHQSNHDISALLQISLPTNSLISQDQALKIIQEEAYQKGWKPERIVIIRTGGYVKCNDCKKSLHIHVATENATYCMNCGHLNNSRITQANVHIINE